jgi:hypothetical protein
MLRIILAGVAAVAIGTVGGLTLMAATPARDAAPQTQVASSEIAAPSPKIADPAPVSAPKRTAEAAPAPAVPNAQPDPAPQATTGDAKPDKPEIRFDGDRVSVRFGKFKIDF